MTQSPRREGTLRAPETNHLSQPSSSCFAHRKLFWKAEVSRDFLFAFSPASFLNKFAKILCGNRVVRDNSQRVFGRRTHGSSASGQKGNRQGLRRKVPRLLPLRARGCPVHEAGRLGSNH